MQTVLATLHIKAFTFKYRCIKYKKDFKQCGKEAVVKSTLREMNHFKAFDMKIYRNTETNENVILIHLLQFMYM